MHVGQTVDMHIGQICKPSHSEVPLGKININFINLLYKVVTQPCKLLQYSQQGMTHVALTGLVHCGLICNYNQCEVDFTQQSITFY